MSQAATAQLAKAYGMRVVAEGVATENQRKDLMDCGCDELQGYHFAKPMPAHKIEAIYTSSV